MDQDEETSRAGREPETLYLELAAAFVRGRLAGQTGEPVPADDARAASLGARRGLAVHRFKRSALLPRVRRVLGVLRGLAPASVLDIGSGRGAFLWPLLDQLPGARVLAADRSERAVADIAAVARGGVSRLGAARLDATRLGLARASHDVVTILEVLEHLEDPAAAAREAIRVARGFVVASVPSVPDENPEHLRLYDRASLERLLRDAGARRVTIEYVLNHMVAVARV